MPGKNIKGGFTLIEVVAAIVIVAVGLVTVLETFSMGNRVMALRNHRTAVIHMLERLVEEAKAKDFTADLNVDTAYCNTIPNCGTMCDQVPDCTYEINQLNNIDGLPLKGIYIKIMWTPLGWGSQEAEVYTTIAQR